MSSEKPGKSAAVVLGTIGVAATILGGISAIQATVKEKKKVKEKLKNNNAQCKACFVKPGEIVANEGDLIQIKRDVYAHWGVYVGNGDVIHLVHFSNGKARIVKQCLEDIAVGCVCRVNNLLKSAQRRRLTPKTNDDILKAAYGKLNNKLKFDLIKNNCEHFATYCRYGKRFSEQAKATEGMPIIRTLGPFLANSSPILAASIAKLTNE